MCTLEYIDSFSDDQISQCLVAKSIPVYDHMITNRINVMLLFKTNNTLDAENVRYLNNPDFTSIYISCGNLHDALELTKIFTFYSNKKESRGYSFSNFSNHPITVNGVYYPTTEHYYQSMKFLGTDEMWMEVIRKSPTPGIAKKNGSSKTHRLRTDWEEVKNNIMWETLWYKVSQNRSISK